MFAPKVAKPQASAKTADILLPRRPSNDSVAQASVDGVVSKAAPVWDFGKVRTISIDRPEQTSLRWWLPLRPSVPIGIQSVTDATREASAEDGAIAPPSQAELSAVAAHVRIRDDPSADRSAYLMGAHAVTFGDQILFRRGHYAPHTEPGRALIAHELTHVVHQSRTGRPHPQRLVAGDVLSVQFTQAMAEAMTSSELDQQMQLLRAHLLSAPGDLGAAENLVILETVARARRGAVRPVSALAAPALPGLAQPASTSPPQAPVTAPGQQKPQEEEQHSKIWWWLHEHGRLTMTKHDRAEIQRTLIKQRGGVILDNVGFPVDVDRLSDDEVIEEGPELLRPREEDQPPAGPKEVAAILSRKEFGDIIDWGESNAPAAVKKTEGVTQGLTGDKVKKMITEKGLTKASVLENLKLYEEAAKNPVKVAKNSQLLPRLKLLRRLLELWPG